MHGQMFIDLLESSYYVYVKWLKTATFTKLYMLKNNIQEKQSVILLVHS